MHNAAHALEKLALTEVQAYIACLSLALQLENESAV